MSIDVMSAVWRNAPVKGGRLLVLLALADHANHLGHCWPSVPKLAEKARLSERQVYTILNELECQGHITIERGTGVKGGNYYRVNFLQGEVCNVTPEAHLNPPLKPTSPKPSLEPSLEPSSGNGSAGKDEETKKLEARMGIAGSGE